MSLLSKTGRSVARYSKAVRLSMVSLILAASVSAPALHAQERPNLAAQKAAMEKFSFLAGTWTGEAAISFGPDKQIKIEQTEEVQYKLDNSVLLIEGTGRDQAGKVVFSALAVVSYDQNAGNYRIRAWNNGNFVEAEMKLVGTGFEWGFQRGPMTVLDRMTVDEQGRWSETSEAVLSDGRKLHTVRMLLSRKP